MIDKEELISIIVPVYNVKPFLLHCLETIVSQSYHNLEIILVDDGSTDGSGEICDSFAETDKKLIYIGNWDRSEYGKELKSKESLFSRIKRVLPDYFYRLRNFKRPILFEYPMTDSPWK